MIKRKLSRSELFYIIDTSLKGFAAFVLFLILRCIINDSATGGDDPSLIKRAFIIIIYAIPLLYFVYCMIKLIIDYATKPISKEMVYICKSHPILDSIFFFKKQYMILNFRDQNRWVNCYWIYKELKDDVIFVQDDTWYVEFLRCSHIVIKAELIERKVRGGGTESGNEFIHNLRRIRKNSDKRIKKQLFYTRQYLIQNGLIMALSTILPTVTLILFVIDLNEILVKGQLGSVVIEFIYAIIFLTMGIAVFTYYTSRVIQYRQDIKKEGKTIDVKYVCCKSGGSRGEVMTEALFFDEEEQRAVRLYAYIDSLEFDQTYLSGQYLRVTYLPHSHLLMKIDTGNEKPGYNHRCVEDLKKINGLLYSRSENKKEIRRKLNNWIEFLLPACIKRPK